jgi:1-acyl-sn-glycerol-3-phosphate acyltransferase
MRAEWTPSIHEQIEQLAREVMPGGPSELSTRDELAVLGFDSLACADLSLAVEEHFGVRLADSDISEFRTLGDVAAAVEARPVVRIGLPSGIGRSVGFAKAVAGPVVRWWFHMRITGTEHVPEGGPVLVAANHRSMWDIPMLVIGCPRRVVFMAKIELYKNWLLKRLWFELGGFPVRREIADLRAVENSLAVLDTGGALGIYPEGTRSFTGEMLPFLKGAAWLALKTGAPIVPCGISGTGKRTRGDQARSRARRPVIVAFGPPVHVDPEPDSLARREKAEALTDQLLEAISALL